MPGADVAPQALLKLLKTGALQKARSVIAYCAFTAQADQVARFLAAQGISALSYHAQKPHQVSWQRENSRAWLKPG